MKITLGKCFLALMAACRLSLSARTAQAQTPQEVRRKLTDLREDTIPLNCTRASVWLFNRREKLKNAILDELYHTDRQARDCILNILFFTRSFVPDERFDRLVVSRLAEEDKYVDSNTIGSDYLERTENVDKLIDEGYSFNAANRSAWEFIEKHFEAFRPLLAEQVKTTKSMWALWGTAWMFRHHKILAQYAPLYTPEVLAIAAANLQDDEIDYNASMAARLFLILGDQSLPALRLAAKAKDAQERGYARDLIEGIKGSHPALVELNSSLNITRTPLGDEDEPEWLTKAMLKSL